MKKRKPVIKGNCPNCNSKDSVVFSNHYYYGSSKPHHIDLPTCRDCCFDEIRVRKINNRRYKIHEIQWEEYYLTQDY